MMPKLCILNAFQITSINSTDFCGAQVSGLHGASLFQGGVVGKTWLARMKVSEITRRNIHPKTFYTLLSLRAELPIEGL
jgi:hypothetical protein